MKKHRPHLFIQLGETSVSLGHQTVWFCWNALWWVTGFISRKISIFTLNLQLNERKTEFISELSQNIERRLLGGYRRAPRMRRQTPTTVCFPQLGTLQASSWSFFLSHTSSTRGGLVSAPIPLPVTCRRSSFLHISSLPFVTLKTLLQIPMPGHLARAPLLEFSAFTLLFSDFLWTTRVFR